MFARSLLLSALASGYSGCAPYRPPPEPPRLVQAQAPARVVEAEGPPAVSVVIRAGSAYDPPSREGLAFVSAQELAGRAGVAVEVGPELVRFTASTPDQVAALARVFSAPGAVEAIEQARAQAFAALDGGDCEPTVAAAAATWAHVGHPYGHAVAGRRSVLPTLTLAEIEGFRARRYVRDALVLVRSGGLDPAPLSLVAAPVMSPLVTPTVRSGVPRGDLQVSAPVATGCEATAPRKPAAWTALDEASFRVAAQLAGASPPPPLVDALPVLIHTSRPTGDFASAVAAVRAEATRPLRLAADVLLAPVRSAASPASKAVLAALDTLTEPGLVAWTLATFGPDAVHVRVVPAESPGGGAVSAAPSPLPFAELTR